jgi:hypothetical protein
MTTDVRVAGITITRITRSVIPRAAVVRRNRRRMSSRRWSGVKSMPRMIAQAMLARNGEKTR